MCESERKTKDKSKATLTYGNPSPTGKMKKNYVNEFASVQPLVLTH